MFFDEEVIQLPNASRGDSDANNMDLDAMLDSPKRERDFAIDLNESAQEILPLPRASRQASAQRPPGAAFVEELEKIEAYVGTEAYTNGKFELATELFKKLVATEEFEEFLTLNAYNYI